MMTFLREFLAHPLTRRLPLDSPDITKLRQRIILEKNFLRNIYQTWYQLLINQIPAMEGEILEVGSGGGFLKDMEKGIISSEVFFVPHVDVVCNAMAMPFREKSLRAVLMVDVLHHVSCPEFFFSEAARCVKSGGRCLLVEPWNTSWGRWIYQHFHHEPFDPDAGWAIPASGPLSGANGALPWILLERDRDLFTGKFPEWRIVQITPIMPMVYLLSGGVSMRSLMPAWIYPWIRKLETLIPGVEKRSGMFAFIVLERN